MDEANNKLPENLDIKDKVQTSAMAAPGSAKGRGPGVPAFYSVNNRRFPSVTPLRVRELHVAVGVLVVP